MSEPIGGIFIPADTLTPDEMAEFLESYAQAALPGVVRFYKTMARPGVTFTDEQKAQIQAMVEAGKKADAQRVILDRLKEEFEDE